MGKLELGLSYGWGYVSTGHVVRFRVTVRLKF